MGTFIIEEWVEDSLGDGKFTHYKNLTFDTHTQAHEEVQRLRVLGELSEKAVVVYYPERKEEEDGEGDRDKSHQAPLV